MDMIVSTMNDLPGYTIDEVLGEVTGLTVRSRNVGTQIGAGFKSLVGGELKGLTKQLLETRSRHVRACVKPPKRSARTPSSRCASTATKSGRATRSSWRTAPPSASTKL